jgi:hypothetical protein
MRVRRKKKHVPREKDLVIFLPHRTDRSREDNNHRERGNSTPDPVRQLTLSGMVPVDIINLEIDSRVQSADKPQQQQ